MEAVAVEAEAEAVKMAAVGVKWQRWKRNFLEVKAEALAVIGAVFNWVLYVAWRASKAVERSSKAAKKA